MATVAALGAALAGVLAGIVALAYFAYFVRELKRRKLNYGAGSATLSILFGATLISAPVGRFALSQEIWPWFLVGEVLVFVPATLWVVYKYALPS